MSHSELYRRRQEILVEAPLYREFSAADESDDYAKEIARFANGEGHIDTYCPACDTVSVLKIQSTSKILDQQVQDLPLHGVFTVHARCSRSHTEDYLNIAGNFYASFLRDHRSIKKIGQHPSRAESDFAQLDDVFEKELADPLRTELGTAVGLRSHGVGIGSFVYLRRIFEQLVDEAHQKARQRADWDEDSYRRKRMSGKIEALHAYLPNRLVEYADLYSVLSKGIHELKEEQCLATFDLILESIRMILNQRHDEKKHDELVRKVKQANDNISG